MPSKLLLRNFESGHTYHLRHAAKDGLQFFHTPADYQYFTLLLSYYLRFPDATPLSWVKRLSPQTVIRKRNSSQLGVSPVTLHAFLLLPDHFHLVLRENIGTYRPGISNLLRHPDTFLSSPLHSSRSDYIVPRPWISPLPLPLSYSTKKIL